MHDTAREIGRIFFESYWTKEYRRILDLGAMNYNGSLRDYCPVGADYLGVDLEAGNGVDLVIDDPARLPFENDSFDVIVSSSCFEHDSLFWMTFLELVRVLKPGGVLYINAPSNGAVHRFPLDCWRFYPDAAVALIKWAALNGIEVTLAESFTVGRLTDVWNDCVMIFGKGEALEPRHLCEKLPVAVWNITFADGAIRSPNWETEDMLLVRGLTERWKSADANCRQMLAGLALSRAPVRTTLCAVCGQAVSPEVPRCPNCESSPQSRIMAQAIASFFGSLQPLQALVVPPAPPGRVLELNDIGSLSSVLRQLPNYVIGGALEEDFMSLPYDDNTFDIVIHANFLNHVADPIRVLAECRRILKNGGACIFTLPITMNRPSDNREGDMEDRDRVAPGSDGAPTRTQFGTDVWTYAMRAAFARVTIDSLNQTELIAITAWKDAL